MTLFHNVSSLFIMIMDGEYPHVRGVCREAAVMCLGGRAAWGRKTSSLGAAAVGQIRQPPRITVDLHLSQVQGR